MEKLRGILIAVFSRGGKVSHRFLIVTLDLSAVKINLTELVFRIVVSVLGGNFKVADRFPDILDRILGKP